MRPQECPKESHHRKCMRQRYRLDRVHVRLTKLRARQSNMPANIKLAVPLAFAKATDRSQVQPIPLLRITDLRKLGSEIRAEKSENALVPNKKMWTLQTLAKFLAARFFSFYIIFVYMCFKFDCICLYMFAFAYISCSFSMITLDHRS